MKKKIIFVVMMILIAFTSNTVFATNQIVQIQEVEQPSMIDSNIILGIIVIVEISVTSLVIIKNRNNLVKANIIMLIIFGILTILSVVLKWVLGISASDNINDYNEFNYLSMNHVITTMLPINFIPLILSIILLPISIAKSKK